MNHRVRAEMHQEACAAARVCVCVRVGGFVVTRLRYAAARLVGHASISCKQLRER